MKWQIDFFNEKVFDDAQNMPNGIKAKFIKISELIEEFGPEIGMPYVENIKGSDCHGLFEMRPKGKEGIARAFFCTLSGKKVIILHCVIKKARKVRKADLETAKRRMKEVKDDKSKF
jgi:phage-related protein